jgi:hypothetical protein
MSQLNSLFDVLAGLPPHGKSALEYNFKQKAAEAPILIEGMIGKVVNEAGVPVLTKLTSANVGVVIPPDYPWLVIEGMDTSDAVTANKVTALALKSGVIFKVATAGPGGFAVGDLVYANNGIIAKVVAAQQSIGQVIEINATSGYLVIAAGGSGV